MSVRSGDEWDRVSVGCIVAGVEWGRSGMRCVAAGGDWPRMISLLIKDVGLGE